MALMQSPQKIKRYDTVSAPTVLDLTRKVNDTIEQGWQPFGSLVLDKDAMGLKLYVQPMVMCS